MNREIKFRGKDITTKQWHYGDLLQYNDGSVCIGVRSETFTDDGYQNPDYKTVVGVDEETIGQFTGLTDKKGREIYEGDVLRINNGAVICLLVVTWNAEVGSWCLRFIEELKEGTRPLGRWLCDRDYDIELTGNIYDNKELLEE